MALDRIGLLVALREAASTVEGRNELRKILSPVLSGPHHGTWCDAMAEDSSHACSLPQGHIGPHECACGEGTWPGLVEEERARVLAIRRDAPLVAEWLSGGPTPDSLKPVTTIAGLEVPVVCGQTSGRVGDSDCDKGHRHSGPHSWECGCRRPTPALFGNQAGKTCAVCLQPLPGTL